MDNRNLTASNSAPSSGSQTCPTCGFINRAGVLLCENCGTNLLTGQPEHSGTKQFQKPAVENVETGMLVQKSPAVLEPQNNPPVPETGMLVASQKPGDDASSTVVNVSPSKPAEADAPRKPVDIAAYMVEAVMTAGSDVFSDQTLLRLEIEGSSTPVVIEPKSETTLGRRDPATGTMPDVDLTTYAGYRMGVSRKHAIIRRRAGQLDMYDLGSSNGTHVNDKRLIPHQPVVLRDGDVILLGKMTIRVLFQLNRRQS